jgi:hypothetical protein
MSYGVVIHVVEVTNGLLQLANAHMKMPNENELYSTYIS